MYHLPLPLQYLDSLIYRWWSFDKKIGSLEDPRVRDERVRRTAAETVGDLNDVAHAGWERMLTMPWSLSDAEFVRAARDNVWPRFRALRDEALRDEEVRRAYERMMKEDQANAQSAAPYDQLSPEQKQAAQDYFDSLPQDV